MNKLIKMSVLALLASNATSAYALLIDSFDDTGAIPFTVSGINPQASQPGQVEEIIRQTNGGNDMVMDNITFGVMRTLLSPNGETPNSLVFGIGVNQNNINDPVTISTLTFDFFDSATAPSTGGGDLGTFSSNESIIIHDYNGAQNAGEAIVTIGFDIFDQSFQDNDFLKVSWTVTGRNGGFENIFLSEGFTNNPVPIPAAFWLFGSALIGLFGLTRRTKH